MGRMSKRFEYLDSTTRRVWVVVPPFMLGIEGRHVDVRQIFEIRGKRHSALLRLGDLLHGFVDLSFTYGARENDEGVPQEVDGDVFFFQRLKGPAHVSPTVLDLR